MLPVQAVGNYSARRWAVGNPGLNAGGVCWGYRPARSAWGRKPFYIGDDVAFGLLFRGIHGPVHSLIFQGREETFGHRIVPTHASFTHR